MMLRKDAPILTQSAPAREALRVALGAWFREHGRDLPWRRTRDPYAILVSELMLQQTQVATVKPYFERWLQLFPSFAALAEAPEPEVLHAWQGLGYYARARNLHAAARAVVERHAGMLPDDPIAIAALPGVGRYTQGAIASFAFDRPAAAVDANIARVLARLYAIAEPIDTTPGQREIWKRAEELLPKSGGGLHTSALMELGALICTPRQPQCLTCPARPYCSGQGSPELFPAKKARRATVDLDENCAWIVKNGRVLLEEQTGKRWRGLWKLPLITGQLATTDRAKLLVPVTKSGGLVSSKKSTKGVSSCAQKSNADADDATLVAAPFFESTYPFTHHRVHLRVYSQVAPKKLSENQRWFDLSDLEGAALPSPHRRAVEALAKSGDLSS